MINTRELVSDKEHSVVKEQNADVVSNERFDAYPASKRKDRLFVVDRGRCKGCKICTSVCPYDAIYMSSEKTGNGFFYPIENGKCKACRKCIYACPDFALSIHKTEDMEVKA